MYRGFRDASLLVCVVGGLGLSGCSTERLDRLEAQIRDIRSTQADHSSSIDELRAGINQLSGKVEETRYTAVGKAQELESKLQRFGSRVPPPSGVPVELLEDDEKKISRNSGAAADLFRQGLGLLRSGDLEGAKSIFEQFLSENPDTTYSDNALFWIAICQSKLGQSDRAIVSYSDVVKKFPAEDRAAASLYSLGEEFVKMQSTNDAVLSFQKLVDDYPRSEFAGKSRARLAELRPAPATKKSGTQQKDTSRPVIKAPQQPVRRNTSR